MVEEAVSNTAQPNGAVAQSNGSGRVEEIDNIRAVDAEVGSRTAGGTSARTALEGGTFESTGRTSSTGNGAGSLAGVGDVDRLQREKDGQQQEELEIIEREWEPLAPEQEEAIRRDMEAEQSRSQSGGVPTLPYIPGVHGGEARTLPYDPSHPMEAVPLDAVQAARAQFFGTGATPIAEDGVPPGDANSQRGGNEQRERGGVAVGGGN